MSLFGPMYLPLITALDLRKEKPQLTLAPPPSEPAPIAA